MADIQRIGVLTSGGDSPGMNAAVRAVTRAAIYNKIKVTGIYRGYKGLIEGMYKNLESQDVSNIIYAGGTVLKSARSEEFKTPEGRQKAYENLKEASIDGLVAIGGDGTFAGARLFTEEHPDISVAGIPGTIDNDLYGTDYTVGYDTAINTVVDAVDKIRDTATAHDRLFFVEVMGRDAGFLALRSGIAAGAEAVLIPELETDVEELEEFLQRGLKKEKNSSIVIVAEGDEAGGAFKIADKVREKRPELSIRVTVLGHLQRGGRPSAFDRVAASRLGVSAVEALIDGKSGIMVGLSHKDVIQVPFEKALKNKKEINKSLLEIKDILSI